MSVFGSKEIRFTKEWSGNDKHLLLSNTGWRYRISVSRKTQDRSSETKDNNFLIQ